MQILENFPIIVGNYDVSIDEILEKSDCYLKACRELNSRNFPFRARRCAWTTTSWISLDLVNFGREIPAFKSGYKTAAEELKSIGYRPAETHELLVFGNRYSRILLLRKILPVAAVGSVWRDPTDDSLNVPFIGAYACNSLFANVMRFDRGFGKWPKGFWFAVEKNKRRESG